MKRKVAIYDIGLEKLRKANKPLTNHLTPNRPYLVLLNGGIYQVAWWNVFFDVSGKWAGSTFLDFDAKNENRQYDPFTEMVWPVKVWELPGVKYDKPRNITSPQK